MKIKIDKYYITETRGGYYSDWIVQPIGEERTNSFVCLVIKGKDLPIGALHLPFSSHELHELSPVMQALFES